MKPRLLHFIFIAISLIAIQGCCGRSCIVASANAKMEEEAKKSKSTPQPKTIKKDIEPNKVVIDDIFTPKEERIIKEDLIKRKIPRAEGKLIQVEGLVAKEVSELTIDLETGPNQINQILSMRDFVKNKWHYVFDPATGHDTWRSAEATLALKYKGRYTGDCDDYAILMASFARQIGLRSRMVGGYDNGSGHAFAEFLLPNNQSNNPSLRGNDYRTDSNGKWVSLDWFSGSEHNKYTHDIKVFEDI